MNLLKRWKDSLKPRRPTSGYSFRIYQQTGQFQVVALTLSTTVQDLSEKLKSTLSPQDQRIQHDLYLKEQGRERILAPHEHPAEIVASRRGQAGYDYEDGVHLFSSELLKFVYKKSQVLAGQAQVRFDTFVDEDPPPIGHVTLVFTKIRNYTHLWDSNPGMQSALRVHNHLLRRRLRLCGGYEVKTAGGKFICSFPTTLSAVWFCLTVQLRLLDEPWPLEILQSEDGKLITDNGQLIARGLSVRMGIYSGTPCCETNIITRRMDYLGPVVNRSASIRDCAKGGQILVSNDIIREIKASVLNTEEATKYSALQNPTAVEAIRDLGVVIQYVGEVKLKGIKLPEILYAIYPSGLEGRHELDENPLTH